MVVARERFFCWGGSGLVLVRGVGLGVPVGGGARGRLVGRVLVADLRVVLALIRAVGRRGAGRLVGLPVLRILVSGCLLGVGALVGGVLVLGGADGGNLSGVGGVLGLLMWGSML